MELLTAKDLLPDFSIPDIDALVYTMDEDLRANAIRVAGQLRTEGIKVDVVLDSRKPKWAFQRAEKLGASAVVLVAPDEAARGEILVKDMAKRKQMIVKEEDTVGVIAGILADIEAVK